MVVATRLFESRWRIPPQETFHQAKEHLVSVREIREAETLSVVIDGVLSGDTALLRRKIKDRSLKFESMDIGNVSKTCVCLVYIKGISNFRSERPDTVAGKLLEGRIAIIIDGSPAVLTVPAIFTEFLISCGDYYDINFSSTITRWLRFIAFPYSVGYSLRPSPLAKR